MSVLCGTCFAQHPQYLNAGLSLASINNVDFISLYNGTITDTELRDITQHIAGPEFILYPQEKRVRVRMWVDANDTTDNVRGIPLHYIMDCAITYILWHWLQPSIK